MLSISKKSEYGLRALLVLAENYNKRLVQIREMASRQNIPRQYLEQILNRLGKAGIIRSVRGNKGGYLLARPPEKITAAEIIALLEGGIAFASPTEDPTDIIFLLFQKAEKNLQESLAVSLADLLARQQKFKNIPSYSI
jgi:Rrf2 family cysteine metabolism transcriptional repressor